MGPILLKMGIRHCCPYNKFSEAELAPYKLTFSMAPWSSKNLDEFFTRNPSVRLGMIFHETVVPTWNRLTRSCWASPNPN